MIFVQDSTELPSDCRQLFLPDIITVLKLGVVFGHLTKSGSKGVTIGDAKACLQSGAPKIAVKRFQDEGIRPGTRTRHDVLGADVVPQIKVIARPQLTDIPIIFEGSRIDKNRYWEAPANFSTSWS